MHETLVKNAQHDIDRDYRGEYQIWLACKRFTELRGVAGEHSEYRGGHADFVFDSRDDVQGVAKRGILGEIETDCRRRKLLLMRDRERRAYSVDMNEGSQRRLRAPARRADIKLLQRLRVALILLRGFEYDAILI